MKITLNEVNEGKIKLPKVFKNKWIKALRSGKYKQTKGSLCDDFEKKGELDNKEYGYCCLGVACAIVSPKSASFLQRKASKAKNGSFGGFIQDFEKNFKGLGLSKLIPKELVGAEDTYNYLTSHLASMNDDGNNFDEVADYIEKNL